MQHLSQSLIAAFLLVPLSADAQDVFDNPEVLRILDMYLKQCNETQAEFRDIDSDLDAPLRGKLDLGEDTIYQIEIGQHDTLVTATVIYPHFRCENVGYSWCGTGGCGFHVLIGEKTFYHPLGFAPFTMSTGPAPDDRNVLAYQMHGVACLDTDGQSGRGVDPCLATAVWDENKQTFFSIEGGFADGYDP